MRSALNVTEECQRAIIGRDTKMYALQCPVARVVRSAEYVERSLQLDVGSHVSAVLATDEREVAVIAEVMQLRDRNNIRIICAPITRRRSPKHISVHNVRALKKRLE